MFVSCPHFLIADVRRAAEYYRDRLGFRIIGHFFEEPPVFGMVDRDGAEIHLRKAYDGLKGSNRERVGDALDCYTPSSWRKGPRSSSRRSCATTA
mgnify:CR=1 FL=1